jgi:hypothetical protein
MKMSIFTFAKARLNIGSVEGREGGRKERKKEGKTV